MDDVPIEHVIGIVVSINDDGTMTSPMFTGSEDTLYWYSTDDRLTLDTGELTSGFDYTIENDTMEWHAEFTFVGSIIYEYKFFRL